MHDLHLQCENQPMCNLGEALVILEIKKIIPTAYILTWPFYFFKNIDKQENKTEQNSNFRINFRLN